MSKLWSARCPCGWGGPSRPTSAAAERDGDDHAAVMARLDDQPHRPTVHAGLGVADSAPLDRGTADFLAHIRVPVRANPNFQGPDAWGLYERTPSGHCGRLLLGHLDEAMARRYEAEVNARVEEGHEIEERKE